MNYQRLASFYSIVDHDFNISRAATATKTSQPGISRHIRFLEEDLGVHLFYRNKKRLTGLTKAGEAVLEVAKRMRIEADNLEKIGSEFSSRDQGDLTIATTHTYARYSLPCVIRQFASTYPNVRLVITQGNPTENASWVVAGEADLFISTAPAERFDDLLLLPFDELDRVVVVTKGHPLLSIPKPSLRDVARYPIITYNPAFLARSKTLSTFKSHGIQLNMVLSATDADVIKTYVREGLGIAIMSALAYSAKDDKDLYRIDVRHLFEPHVINIGLRKQSYLRSYAYHFIEMFAPKLKRRMVEKALAG